MQYTMFNTELFIKALSNVKPAISSKEVIKQSDKFVFKNKKVYASNDLITISFPIEYDLECAVPFNNLYSFLKDVSSTEIGICIKDARMHLKGGKLKANFSIDEKIELPIQDFEIESDSWNTLPDNFNEALTFGLLSIGTDQTNVILTCLHWTPEYIESCDNFRLTRYYIETPELLDIVLLPIKIIKNLKNYDVTEFIVTKNVAHFRTMDDCIFSCRIYSGEYVDLSDIINREHNEKILFNDSIISLLNSVSTTADKDIYGHSKAKMIIADKKVTIIASNDSGEIEGNNRIICDSNISFDFKIEALLQILKFNKESYIDDSKKSLSFKGDNWIHIISLT